MTGKRPLKSNPNIKLHIPATDLGLPGLEIVRMRVAGYSIELYLEQKYNMKREEKMTLKYIIYKDEKYFVAQCLNVDVSSFGETIQEAQENIKEALELYFEDEERKKEVIQIDEVLFGETVVNV